MSESVQARFDRIVHLHGAALRRLAHGYGRTAADGDDLFQEICFAIWRALPTFREECTERTFAYRIGHNRGLSYRVRQRPESSELAEEIRDPSPGPDTLATRAIQRDRLLGAIRQLPDGHRQVVLLSLEGSSHAEIGAVLGITENNVAVRLTRARKALRDLLVPPGGDR